MEEYRSHWLIYYFRRKLFHSFTGFTHSLPFDIVKFSYSSVAQWQSMRLLTAGLLVRVRPGEHSKTPDSI
jgi:hypothetical protein